MWLASGLVHSPYPAEWEWKKGGNKLLDIFIGNLWCKGTAWIAMMSALFFLLREAIYKRAIGNLMWALESERSEARVPAAPPEQRMLRKVV